MTKRILALLLCLALCLSLIPAAFAGEIEIADEPEELAEKTPEALPEEEIALDEPGEPGDEIGVIDPEEIAIPDEPEQASPGPDAELQATLVEEGTAGDLSWRYYDNGELYIYGSGDMPNYSSRDDQPWAAYREQITYVDMGWGITSIGNNAFAGCRNMRLFGLGGDEDYYYSLPDTLTRIGDYAFINCDAVDYVYIPDKVTYVGEQAFDYCDGLKRVTVGGAPTLGKWAFGDCTVLEEISFLGGVPTFAYNTFSGSHAATAWYPTDMSAWPSDVLKGYGGSITWQAGYHGWCGDDISWSFDPGSGTLTVSGSGRTWDYHGDQDFRQLGSYLQALVVEEGVTEINRNTFHNMNYLRTVSLPSTLQTIGSQAFASDGKIEEIEIPTSVTQIGYGAFANCSALTAVTIWGAPSIGSKAFNNCSALKDVFFKGHAPTSFTATAFEGITATAYYYPVYSWTSDKMQQYGGTLTWSCDDKIGDDVTWDLYENGRLTINGSGATLDYPSSDYPAFYGFRDEITEVNVYGTGIQLGSYLFYGLDKVEAARIKNVTAIGERCFSYCDKLKLIRFCDFAPSFGNNAFYRVTATAYYPPITDGGWTDDVMQNYGGTITWVCDNKIGDDVYWTLDTAGNLNITGTGPTWDYTESWEITGRAGFYYSQDQIKKAVVGEGVTRLGDYLLKSILTLQSLQLPSTLTEIGSCAVLDCRSLKAISIPKSVTSIERNAFNNCQSAQSLYFYGAPTLGYDAFDSCFSLKEIRFFGHAPTSINSTAFDRVTATAYYPPVYSWTEDKLQDYGTGTLTWVKDEKVGDDVTWYLDEDGTLTMTGTGNISDWYAYNPLFHCFYDEITSAVVGEGVTELGRYLFWNMDKLNKVSLPSTLTKVGSGAFVKCTSLSAITIPASVTEIKEYAFDECSALKEIRFLGAAPTIGYNCFYMDTATAYYPADDPSWTEDVRQQYGATKLTWMPYTPMTLNGDAISATLPVHDSMSLVVKDSGGTFVTDASWSTSDPGVATVDENGVITAVKYGKCTITASTEGGINTAECALQTLFWDVADSSKYYFKHVYWAAEKGITKGYDLEYFDPQGTCTREQMMTFLWRLAGQPNPKTTSSPFPDVKSGAYYYKAVLWGVEKGITNGYSSGPYAGKFGVGLACTREQAMTFLWRMAGKPNPKSLTNKFSDVKSTDYFFKAVLWAAENGIANGYADGTYGVGLDCLREHMVTFLSRYASKFPQH